MISRQLIAAAFVALGLLGCTEQVPSVFGDPVPLTVPSGKPAFGARITQFDSNHTILSWMERKEAGAELRFSSFELGEWQPARSVLTDEKMFANWADLPGVTATGQGALLAYWLSYTADAPYAYQVLTAFSDDDGVTFSSPHSPHSDGTPTEHGFVSTFAANGTTGMIWLDGRKTPDAGMTLRSAALPSAREVTDKELMDDLVCDCCQTDIAETSKGPVAVYRNRTEDEVRDIFVARRVDGAWQAGEPIFADGWVISGCPVNGPSISADGEFVVVAWFTAAGDTPTVKAAISTNAGKSFGAPFEIASGHVTGRVGTAIINRDSVAVSWIEADDKGTHAINIRSITRDGHIGRVETAGRTSVSRTVPQFARVDDQLVLVWSDEISDVSKVVSVRIPIIGFYE